MAELVGLMQRIVHLITSLDVGGAERMLLELVTRMDREAFDQQVVCLIPIGPIGRQMQARGVQVTSLGMMPGRLEPAGFLRLLGLLRAGKPHVLQTWLYHADLLGLLGGRLAGVPVILWNVRNSGMDFSHYRRLSGIVMRACARLSPLPRAVVVNSRAGQADHVRLGYRPRAWKLIPNGVDTRRFSPDAEARAALRNELGVPERSPLVGMIARYDPMKGHAVFMRAAGEIIRQKPEVRFLLAGLRVDDGNRELKDHIVQNDLTQHVTLLGPRPDVERLYAALDVFASASIFGEGFSNATAEAMSSGVPCMVTDVGDSAWIVGETGTAVPAGDASTLARACLNILSLPADQRLQLGQAARRRALAHFSIERAVAEYESFYRAAAV